MRATMHTKPMEDSEGTFGDKWETVEGICPKCAGANISCTMWESNDGAYEDYKYRCNVCQHTWWIDGPDA